MSNSHCAEAHLVENLSFVKVGIKEANFMFSIAVPTRNSIYMTEGRRINGHNFEKSVIRKSTENRNRRDTCDSSCKLFN